MSWDVLVCAEMGSGCEGTTNSRSVQPETDLPVLSVIVSRVNVVVE